MEHTIKNIVFGLSVFLMLFFAATWIKDSEKQKSLLMEIECLQYENKMLLDANKNLFERILQNEEIEILNA